MGFSDLMVQVDLSVRQLLGEQVTYTPGSGSPVTVQGIFDAVYVHADAGKAGVMSSGPAVFLNLTDLPSDPSVDRGARVTFKSVVYSVYESEPDGLGVVLLKLHEA